MIAFSGLTYVLKTKHGISPTIVFDHYGEVLAWLSLYSLFICVLLYLKGRIAPSTEDNGSSGNPIFDYYWGTELYPRIFGIDIKDGAMDSHDNAGIHKSIKNCFNDTLSAWIFSKNTIKLPLHRDTMYQSTKTKLGIMVISNNGTRVYENNCFSNPNIFTRENMSKTCLCFSLCKTNEPSDESVHFKTYVLH